MKEAKRLKAGFTKREQEEEHMVAKKAENKVMKAKRNYSGGTAAMYNFIA
jgi:hypothetical protein